MSRMMESAPFHVSSGDVLADRRLAYARDLRDRGDLAGAADLLQQAADIVPGFAAVWFTLGEVRQQLGDSEGAVAAFRAAIAADPSDCHGASLQLMRLGREPVGRMPEAYVRAVFDQYAANFDAALVERLAYRGPQLLHDAVLRGCAATGRAPHFARALDLGCGTGLAGEAFADIAGELTGVDLSAQMVARAERRGCYHRVHAGDMTDFLRTEKAASADLVLAADAFVYLPVLTPVCHESARVLGPSGLLAFSVETHDGAGVTLGPSLRYACDVATVREALAAAGLQALSIDPATTRMEAGAPVPGLIAVAVKP